MIVCDEDVDGSDRTRVPAPTNPLHPTLHHTTIPYLFSLTAYSIITSIYHITLNPANTITHSIVHSIAPSIALNPSRSPIRNSISL